MGTCLDIIGSSPACPSAAAAVKTKASPLLHCSLLNRASLPAIGAAAGSSREHRTARSSTSEASLLKQAAAPGRDKAGRHVGRTAVQQHHAGRPQRRRECWPGSSGGGGGRSPAACSAAALCPPAGPGLCCNAPALRQHNTTCLLLLLAERGQHEGGAHGPGVEALGRRTHGGGRGRWCARCLLCSLMPMPNLAATVAAVHVEAAGGRRGCRFASGSPRRASAPQAAAANRRQPTPLARLLTVCLCCSPHQTADIAGMSWSRVSKGWLLSVRRADEPALNFLGFKDKVRGGKGELLQDAARLLLACCCCCYAAVTQPAVLTSGRLALPPRCSRLQDVEGLRAALGKPIKDEPIATRWGGLAVGGAQQRWASCFSGLHRCRRRWLGRLADLSAARPSSPPPHHLAAATTGAACAWRAAPWCLRWAGGPRLRCRCPT